MTTPVSSMLLVLLASVIGSIASVFLKAGANRIHRTPEALKAAAPWLITGITLFLGGFVIYTFGAREGSLTVLYPMLALGYVWTMVWSRLFFGEPLNKHKITGVLLVLVGVAFIAAGNR
ncbi:MAG: EamA family transporter [Bryobacterales bacterium]